MLSKKQLEMKSPIHEAQSISPVIYREAVLI